MRHPEYYLDAAFHFQWKNRIRRGKKRPSGREMENALITGVGIAENDLHIASVSSCTVAGDASQCGDP